MIVIVLSFETENPLRINDVEPDNNYHRLLD